MRDIRQLDEAYVESQEPTIVVRQQAILVNVVPIRAVVLRNACIVFDGPNNVVAVLQAKFREYSAENPTSPFEFSALEVILSTLTAGYSKSFETFRPVAEAALREVAKVERPRNEFEQMRGIQTTLAVLESHVVSMRRLLMSLLDNDDDLHMLYLTKMHNDPSLLQGEFNFDVDEATSLLEVHLRDIYGIQSQISLMGSNIQHTARVVDLLWTSKRNYLLLIDMSLRVMLLMLYCTNYWTGLFGQNIRSDFEDNEALFWGTTVFCAVWTFGAYAVVCKMFLARGLSLSWHKRV
ncbi:hypothetical protein, variant [Aphanomyces astaci]|nr:hypothetical protein, variant [Aphanomyces astaci]ETV87157.1 hypothetical protein, variant [Aphanomyces astaci]|eukprot:XP_009823956.1 hypothetical protein, variant [Aphanomyces astaci]